MNRKPHKISVAGAVGAALGLFLSGADGARAQTDNPAAPTAPLPAIFQDAPLTEIAAAAPEAGAVSNRQDALEVSPARQKMYDGMTDAQDKKYDQAIEKLEWVVAADPTLLGAWESLGWSYWAVGREKDARTLWERLVAIAPNEPMGYNLLATVATRAGELDRAQELYQTSLKINPNQYEARFSYARVLLWNGQREKAVAELKELFRLDPDRMDVEIELAWAQYANEEYEAALDHWNHINEIIPDQPDYLLARAQCFVLIGALPEADADARHVLELAPDNRGALNLLADIAVRQRRPEEAVAALKMVMDLAENDAARARVARQLAGYMKSVRDQGGEVFTLRQCVAAAKEAFDLDPDDINGRLFYAELLVADKQYGHAADEFKTVLEKINPFSSRARYGLVETYFGRMMLDDVEKQLNDNLRTLNPSDPYRHLLWARLHFARGNFPLAMEALDRLEWEGAQGAVFTLLYHGLSPSEWTSMPSVRQFRDHVMSLRRAGFRFVTPDEFPAYFKSRQAPALVDDRPALNRAVQSVKYAWSGVKPAQAANLREYVPDRAVCVTFDDGLRASFRYATPTAEELQIRMTMFVPIGTILRRDMYVASFPEIRDWLKTGRWLIGSHLADASLPQPIDKEGRLAHPLPNLIWLNDKNRRESLREYYQRMRYEFRDSRAILLRELQLEPEDVSAVAYPMGDIGQETVCNVNLFNVPEALLNEAEINYRAGFMVHGYGYSMKSDHPMLYKRHEPSRTASGRDVLYEALRQHPVFVARRQRVEMAALQGQLHLALENWELLKRDGYPEEDLAELNEFIQRHLARLNPAPPSVKDETEDRKERSVALRHPYVGLEGSSVKANEMIDEWHLNLKAGLNLNPRLILEARAGVGGLSQTVTTNNWIKVNQTTAQTVREQIRTVENGATTTKDETKTTYTTVQVWSNRVRRTNYKAEETMVGLALNILHQSGSMTILDGRLRSFDGNDWDQVDGQAKSGSGEPVWAVEHQWRPTLAIDTSARYQHDVVPSARDIITYDAFMLRGVWRARDWWHATGRAAYSQYKDDNSLVHASLENFWRLSLRQDLWLGFHSSLDTMDMDSDIYWAPYWDQRHYFILRLRRSYPDYFGMVRVNLGWQKSKARPYDAADLNELTARGADTANPDPDWEPMVGLGVGLTRRWKSGWELTGEFDVNALGGYTERSLIGSLLYRF